MTFAGLVFLLLGEQAQVGDLLEFVRNYLAHLAMFYLSTCSEQEVCLDHKLYCQTLELSFGMSTLFTHNTKYTPVFRDHVSYMKVT